jgi:hypothetical protein
VKSNEITEAFWKSYKGGSVDALIGMYGITFQVAGRLGLFNVSLSFTGEDNRVVLREVGTDKAYVKLALTRVEGGGFCDVVTQSGRKFVYTNGVDILVTGELWDA